jgi:nucleotide-binding universal stress UspA family protein
MTPVSVQPLTRILVAVDDSPAALVAARLAVDLAGRTGATVHFVHVIGDGELVRALESVGRDGKLDSARSEAADALLRHVAATAARAGVAAETSSLAGEPAELVLAVAQRWDADLVVMGRSDVRGPGEPYVGAVTREVLEFSDVPVLVVPVRA